MPRKLPAPFDKEAARGNISAPARLLVKSIEHGETKGWADVIVEVEDADGRRIYGAQIRDGLPVPIMYLNLLFALWTHSGRPRYCQKSEQ